jgi:hypothetical protein
MADTRELSRMSGPRGRDRIVRAKMNRAGRECVLANPRSIRVAWTCCVVNMLDEMEGKDSSSMMERVSYLCGGGREEGSEAAVSSILRRACFLAVSESWRLARR